MSKRLVVNPNEAQAKVCLWFEKDAQGAAEFYAKTFPNSFVGGIQKAPSDNPSTKKGEVLVVEFTVLGIACIGLNGGPYITQSEAFSFQVATKDQEETDRYWNAIVNNGGEESQCGWCKDKWGVSWQITPIALTEAMKSQDKDVASRVFEAMMKMKKIEVAEILKAIAGGSSD